MLESESLINSHRHGFEAIGVKFFRKIIRIGHSTKYKYFPRRIMLKKKITFFCEIIVLEKSKMYSVR